MINLTEALRGKVWYHIADEVPHQVPCVMYHQTWFEVRAVIEIRIRHQIRDTIKYMIRHTINEKSDS